MRSTIKNFTIVLFLLNFLALGEALLMAKEKIVLLTASRGGGMGGGGHTSLRIGKKVFSFHPNSKKNTLILTATPFEKYILKYTVVEERNIISLEIDIPDEKVKQIRSDFLFILEHQNKGIFTNEYSLIKNNCVRPIRNILNIALPQYKIESDFLRSIPYFYMLEFEKTFPVIEKRVYLSKHNQILLEKFSLQDYFVPFSTISPKPEQWRFVYTEDLDGASFILRPVAGAANILSGALQTIFGSASSLFKRNDFQNGLIAILKSVPELLFIPVAMRRGESLPDEYLFYRNEDESIFLNYKLPEIDFIVNISKDGEATELYQKPEIKNSYYYGERKSKKREIREVVALKENIASAIIERVKSGTLVDYYKDINLKVLELKNSHLVFNRNRTLNIKNLKRYLKLQNKNSNGNKVNVVILEKNILPPSEFSIDETFIAYKNFSNKVVTRKKEGSVHAIYAALLIKEFAPAASVKIASYNSIVDMENAVEEAIKDNVDIILHPEVHPSLGTLSNRYREEAPVNKLARKAYDANVLWINSSGNFRESFFIKSLKKEGNFKQETSFKGKKYQIIDFNMNWGSGHLSKEEEDLFEFSIISSNEETLLSTRDRSFSFELPETGHYKLIIEALRLSEEKKYHPIKVFSSTELFPNSPNDNSLASPANSDFVITIGASHKNRPVSYSSEDGFGKGSIKPDFYAPSEFKIKYFDDEEFSDTSAAATYAAAYFAILLGN